jgi:CO dehydrogenase/acetyl-CoA synthase beta subunit
MEKEEAKQQFIQEFTRIVPSFQQFLAQHEEAELSRSAQSEELEQENKIQDEKDRETQMEKQSEEMQRRSIQVLNICS